MHAAAEDDGKFVSTIGFDCRGMDVINWHPEVGFTSGCTLLCLIHLCPLHCAQHCPARADVNHVSGSSLTLAATIHVHATDFFPALEG